jgi:hypothetical protein
MEFTLYTKEQIIDMMENGFPESVKVYVFNPGKIASEGRIFMVPIDNVPVGDVLDDNAGFIGVTKTE